jgi:hypothetical protein
MAARRRFRGWLPKYSEAGPISGSGLLDENLEMIALGGRVPRWLTLGIIALAGLALIVLPDFVNLHGYDVISREVGAALLIVVMLAFTIDRWIEADLLEDTVKATLESVIYKDFITELKRLFSFEFICEYHCEYHDMDISIAEVDINYVRVTSTVERRLTNISGVSKELQAMIHINEWGVAGQSSSIEECYIISPTGEKTCFDAPRFPNAYSVIADTKKIPIPPNGVATLVTRAWDVRSKNDHALGVFMSPNKNPTVRRNNPGHSCLRI